MSGKNQLTETPENGSLKCDDKYTLSGPTTIERTHVGITNLKFDQLGVGRAIQRLYYLESFPHPAQGIGGSIPFRNQFPTLMTGSQNGFADIQ